MASNKTRLKNLGKNTMVEGKTVALITLSMLASRKFLNFQEVFKNQTEDSFIRKNENPIKTIGGAVAAAMIKNPLLKTAALGVSIEGAIGWVRQATVDKDTNESFFPSIGKGMYMFNPRDGKYYTKTQRGWKQINGQPFEQNSTVAGKYKARFMGSHNFPNEGATVAALPQNENDIEFGVAGMSAKMYPENYY